MICHPVAFLLLTHFTYAYFYALLFSLWELELRYAMRWETFKHLGGGGEKYLWNYEDFMRIEIGNREIVNSKFYMT